MLVFTKIKRANLNNIKIWIYYVAHNNTKYYLITSYLLGKPTNNRTRQKIQQNLMKWIKVQNQSETKLINWDSQVNESICLKD